MKSESESINLSSISESLRPADTSESHQVPMVQSELHSPTPQAHNMAADVRPANSLPNGSAMSTDSTPRKWK